MSDVFMVVIAGMGLLRDVNEAALRIQRIAPGWIRLPESTTWLLYAPHHNCESLRSLLSGDLNVQVLVMRFAGLPRRFVRMEGGPDSQEWWAASGFDHAQLWLREIGRR